MQRLDTVSGVAYSPKYMRDILNIVLCPVLLFIPLFLPGCGWFGGEEIPDALVGRWVTSAPRYEEAALEITKETIIFSNGWDFVNVNEIKKVEIEPGDGRTLINITHEDYESGKYTLSLYHHPGTRGGTLQFVNQKHLVWSRADNQ
ncbi:MAG: hypothetical protein K9M82_03785 [Deltaproteobacteria bacterium]|nr:hypothetical protein [Deltaproteobacteria bacterium]